MARVRLRGIEVAYDDVGSGPPLVFLHGFPFNRSMWQEQKEALVEHHRIITLDLRGHGETDVGPSPATMEEMALDVGALLDRLDIERATLAGLSMGGYVALAFCRRFPLRVRALVLADTRAQSDTEDGKANRSTQAAQILREGMEAITDSLLPKQLASETLAKRPDIVRRVRAMIIGTRPEGAAAALEGMARRQDQRSFVSRIIAPVLIIVGSEDTITPIADAELLHREIGGSRLEIIEAAAHLSNLERPEEFNRALAKFLADLEQ
ncbi:MAG TPA: alpha/beta fold hydrolase [Pyrinomonadaceae bacterium]|nr:alpha/beta fold hydrolase [Pyrinomonadaceae bacterium]